MKKCLVFFLAVTLLLSFFGCTTEPLRTTAPEGTDATAGSDSVITGDPTEITTAPYAFDVDLSAPWTVPDVRFGKIAAFSEDGYYLMGGGRLHFFDTNNGIPVILCQKAGCDHSKSNCEAYIRSPHMMFYSDGHIYYDEPARSDPDSIHIFRRNADGTAEESVAVLGQAYFSPQTSLYIGEYLAAEGALYFTAYLMEAVKQDDGSILLLERDAILFRLDLATGKQQEILRKRDTLIRLIGARKDALLFYTVDKLPAETIGDPGYYEEMMNKPAGFQVWDKNNDSFLVLREGTYADFTEILGLQGDKIYYYDRGGKILTYEMASDTVSETEWEDIYEILGDRYILSGKADYFAKTFPQFTDCETGQIIPNDYDDAEITVQNKSTTGCVIQIEYTGEPEPAGQDSYTIPTLRRMLAYVSYDAMSDGLQEKDLLIIADEIYDD